MNHYFECWIAQDALTKFGCRASVVLIDGEPVCGVVAQTGHGTVHVNIVRPYNPENSTVTLYGCW